MNDGRRTKFVVVAGPTASGKSRLGLEICRKFAGEVINCDSVQVYKGFDIGSAKPSRGEVAETPHHLIDIVDWDEEYDAGRYAKEAKLALDEASSRGRLPVVVGGTGLYLRSLFGEGFHGELPKSEKLRQRFAERSLEDLYRMLVRLDPERASELHPNDRVRIERALEIRVLLGHPLSMLPVPKGKGQMRERCYFIYLRPDPEVSRGYIRKRVEEMLAAGFVSEVRGLIERGVSPDSKPMRSIGYRQVADFLAGRIEKKELADKIFFATCQYAKRQRTWFNKSNPDLELRTEEEWDLAYQAVAKFL